MINQHWQEFKEWFWRTLAWWMPRPLTYWCAVRVGAHATTGKWSHTVVPNLTVPEALQRWEER